MLVEKKVVSRVGSTFSLLTSLLIVLLLVGGTVVVGGGGGGGEVIPQESSQGAEVQVSSHATFVLCSVSEAEQHWDSGVEEASVSLLSLAMSAILVGFLSR